MISVFWVLVGIGGSHDAAAVECKNCTRNSSSEKAPALASDWFLISAKTLLPKLPDTFQVTPDQADALVELSSLQTAIQSSSCLQSHKFLPPIRFFVRLSTPQLEKSKERASVLPLDGVGSSNLLLWLTDLPSSSVTASLQALADKKKLIIENSYGEWLKKVNLPYAIDPAEFAFIRSLAVPDLNSAKAILTQEGKSLTLDEKIRVVQFFGASVGRSYDYGRSGRITHPEWSNQELQEKVQQNYWGYLENYASGTLLNYKRNPIGICEDAANIQTQRAEWVGLKNAFSIAYKTPDGTGMHAVAYAESPDDTRRSYLFNYGHVKDQQGRTGTSALHDDIHTLRYYVFDSSGKERFSAPSERDLLRFEGLMGYEKAQSFSPAYIGSGSLARADVDLGANWSGKVFSGQTTRGDILYGVGAVWNLNPAKTARWEVDHTFGASATHTESLPLKSNDLHMIYQAQGHTPWLQNSSEFQIKARGFANVTLQALASIHNASDFDSGDPDWSLTADALLHLGAESQWRNSSATVSGDTTLKAQIVPAAPRLGVRALIPVVDEISLTSNIAYRPQEWAGNAEVLGRVVALYDSIGVTAIGQMTYQTENWKASAAVSGPFSKNQPLFKTFSTPRLDLGGGYRIHPESEIEVQWRQSLEKNIPSELRLKAKLGL